MKVHHDDVAALRLDYCMQLIFVKSGGLKISVYSSNKFLMLQTLYFVNVPFAEAATEIVDVLMTCMHYHKRNYYMAEVNHHIQGHFSTS